MTIDRASFSRGIAMVLQGESLKAGCYVNHNASLGGLREKMARRFIRDKTPSRFHVETGLIHSPRSGCTSRQCDVLVHESAVNAPLYRWEAFVVAHDTESRSVIEVKSNLNQDRFDEMLLNHRSVLEIDAAGGGQVFIPTYGFALTGVTFDTFLTYAQNAITANLLEVADNQRHLNLPICIAVQDRNYIGVRPLSGGVARAHPFYVVDLSKLQVEDTQSIDGFETGYFLEVYDLVLRDKTLALPEDHIRRWFNTLAVDESGKACITGDGEIHRGNTPDHDEQGDG